MLAIRTVSYKILKDRAYEIALCPKYDGCESGIASMVYNFFDKKTGSRAVATSKTKASVNEELAQELHKSVIKKFQTEQSLCQS